MADSEEEVSDLSDEEIDALVGELEAEDENLSSDTEGPAAAPPAPASDEEGAHADVDAGAASPPPAGTPQQRNVPAGTHAEPAKGAAPAGVAAPPAADPAPPATIPAAVVATAKPYQFKSAGATQSLPGALELADGSVLVPPAHAQQFRDFVQRGHALSTTFKEFQSQTRRQMSQLEKLRTDKDITSDAVIAEFEKVMKMAPDERFDYFERMDAERPQMELAIERQKIARDRAALEEQRNPTLSPEEHHSRRETAITGLLTNTWNRIQEAPEVKALPAEGKEYVRRLFARFRQDANLLVRKGDTTKGESEEVFDDAHLVHTLREYIESHRTAAAAPAAAPAGTAADRNAARNADMVVPANPLPPAARRGNPVGAGRTAGQESYKGKRGDWRKDFKSGALDDPE